MEASPRDRVCMVPSQTVVTPWPSRSRLKLAGLCRIGKSWSDGGTCVVETERCPSTRGGLTAGQELRPCQQANDAWKTIREAGRRSEDRASHQSAPGQGAHRRGTVSWATGASIRRREKPVKSNNLWGNHAPEKDSDLSMEMREDEARGPCRSRPAVLPAPCPERQVAALAR
jgi:hypothetical protein